MDLESEGVIVAGCGVGIYLLAFAYELGQMCFWNMPPEYFAMNMSTLLIIGSAFLIIFIPNIFIWLRIRNSPWGRNPVAFRLFLVVSCLISAPTTIFLFRVQWNPSLWGKVVLTIFLLVVILALFKKPINAKVKQESINSRDVDKISTISTVLLIFCFIGLTFYFLGYERAHRQTEYLVTTDDPNNIVLRHYGGNLICAPFDRTTRCIKRKFIIRKSKDIDKLELVLERVGPLRMEKQ